MASKLPEANKRAFYCPYADCGVFSKQVWYPSSVSKIVNGALTQDRVEHIVLVQCDHCHKYSVWYDGKLVHPLPMNAPNPHEDMPSAVKLDYEEARSVFAGSPRSSAALLRLVIQKLCPELGLPGKNLNSDIGALVARGLPAQVQQSLDIVRVVGNNQVHPGVLDVRDDAPLAMTLFELVNIIVENQIAVPKQVAALYAKLPEAQRKQIEERDAKTSAESPEGPA
jgi:Domain of unknown function (DUF4145)